MPLKSGKSREAISKNIKTLVHEYEDEGKIGTSHPPSKKQAVKQAVAISLKKAGVSRSQVGNRRTSSRSSHGGRSHH
ncbi:MAG: hypothetical protein QM803_13755 [Rhodocyclaceae bacterium]